ncbi:MAG: acetate--CoA ligase [Actinobacteria bacterium]|jgi:acetyl-CoA synthetase|uniref:acetate--CoA ligase n=2 Tax=Microbacteriaceae TaxID=85023 RepID=UPI000C62250B|nr:MULTISPECIES: acetate--CoA ligase [unclassified Microbacterium]MEC8762166.1 acetate--CoA ligase [Actinomycetota bacterium]MBU20523.1 acetate--CoA ligase [Microbacterium sp.]RUA26838.1 MAG: acetate--CoA ligase [Actinomycetota bacterium]HAM12100.1 acetate--CoA ligase [Microbacterium sp.]HBS07899.1 acetate--CoA ligase [Microbacterium sp.]|tara:strand:- start:4497 stop:6461 length:1965 start_codon:yes stop_codon:yes gene_type:complete
MSSQIDHLLNETRRFAPSAAFAQSAIGRAELYQRAADDREDFWAEQARELHWHTPFTEVLDWSTPPFAKWFADGALNVAYNCLDRHVEAGNGDRVALLWEGEPGDTRRVTYAELTDEVKRLANVLEGLGVGEGDRVAIYMPMIPESVAAMLAVARIGAIHSVVFGGFSADSLRARIDDAGAKVVITADGGYRKGKVSALKPAVDAALSDRGSGEQETVEHVLVVRRGENPVEWTEGRDIWWHDAVPAASADHEAMPFPAENPLFILYTSGTTGKPKGILHTSGGYLTQAAFTNRVVLDLHPESDVYWCTADIGWITGHSYVTYGPLANGATQVLYEGTPDTPHPARWWELVEKYGVTILYTAPTAIRSFMKIGRTAVQKFDLSSIRLLGSVGEPINPEAWMWYREVIGGDAAPIVDTWWQTETGAIMISALPGVTEAKPGSAQVPLPGIGVDVVDEAGEHVGNGNGGLLVLTEPWPSMLRGIWGDPERFVETYWEKFRDQGYYFAGDGARLDEDGDVWLLGRVDDVMNVSGHRLSTAEIESALVAHEATAEAAVVGASDETTGQAVVAFVILKESFLKAHSPEGLAAQLRSWVAEQIGPIARPRDIYIVGELPKTRSGKIMRRLLRDVAEGREVGDTTTLADTAVMSVISAQVR